MRACLASWLPLVAWLPVATSSAGADGVAPGHGGHVGLGLRGWDLARMVARQDPGATTPTPGPDTAPPSPPPPGDPAQSTPVPTPSDPALVQPTPTDLAPTTTPTSSGVPAWKTKKCERDIVNAALAPDKRWAAADASTALADMMAAWKVYHPAQGEVPFEFSQYASWFFGGPENMRCTQLLDVPCSSILRCEDTAWPAGYLILNSFAKMHQFQRRYYMALDQVQQDVQSEMDLFAENFSVRPADESGAKMTRILLNVIYGMVGIAQASVNNVFIYSTIFESFLTQTLRSQITTASSYSIFTGWAVGKDSLLPAAAAGPQYGKISNFFGDLLDNWKAAEVSYLKTLFSAADTNSTTMLVASIDNGLLGSVPDDVDFRAMATHLKNLLYPQLMLAVWHMHPDAQRPFLLQTGFPCDAKTLEKGQRNNGLMAWLSDDDHHRAAACYKGALWYFLDVNHGKGIDVVVSQHHPSITTSVGATLRSLFGAETIDGTRWGNVTKEDLIESAYGAYLQGGKRNGLYTMDQNAVSPDQTSPLWYGKGVRTPGYVPLPICRSVWNLITNIAMGKPGDNAHPNWPCEIAATNYGVKWEPISFSWDEQEQMVMWDGKKPERR